MFSIIGNGSIRQLAQRRRGLRPERGNPRPPPQASRFRGPRNAAQETAALYDEWSSSKTVVFGGPGGPKMWLEKRRRFGQNGLVQGSATGGLLC